MIKQKGKNLALVASTTLKPLVAKPEVWTETFMDEGKQQTVTLRKSKAAYSGKVHITQHKAETKHTVLAPTVALTLKALRQTEILVDIAPAEVSWFGVVERDGRNFLIDDLYLPQQDVSAGQAEANTAGITNIKNEIKAEFPDNPEKYREKTTKLRLWAHSHGNLAVFASGQDDQQMEKFGSEYNLDYMIRLICNRAGIMKIDVYNYEWGIQSLDLPWSIQIPEQVGLVEKLTASYEKNVRMIVPNIITEFQPGTAKFIGTSPRVSNGIKMGEDGLVYTKAKLDNLHLANQIPVDGTGKFKVGPIGIVDDSGTTTEERNFHHLTDMLKYLRDVPGYQHSQLYILWDDVKNKPLSWDNDYDFKEENPEFYL